MDAFAFAAELTASLAVYRHPCSSEADAFTLHLSSSRAELHIGNRLCTPPGEWRSPPNTPRRLTCIATRAPRKQLRPLFIFPLPGRISASSLRSAWEVKRRKAGAFAYVAEHPVSCASEANAPTVHLFSSRAERRLCVAPRKWHDEQWMRSRSRPSSLRRVFYTVTRVHRKQMRPPFIFPVPGRKSAL